MTFKEKFKTTTAIALVLTMVLSCTPVKHIGEGKAEGSWYSELMNNISKSAEVRMANTAARNARSYADNAQLSADTVWQLPSSGRVQKIVDEIKEAAKKAEEAAKKAEEEAKSKDNHAMEKIKEEREKAQKAEKKAQIATMRVIRMVNSAMHNLPYRNPYGNQFGGGMNSISNNHINNHHHHNTPESYNHLGIKERMLFESVHNGDLATVKVSLNMGANINAKDNLGHTPLYYAVQKNNYSVTKALLNNNPIISSDVENLHQSDSIRLLIKSYQPHSKLEESEHTSYAEKVLASLEKRNEQSFVKGG